MKHPRPVTARRVFSFSIAAAMLMLASALLSLRIGSFDISFPAMFSAIADGAEQESETIRSVLFDIRVPRILTAMFVGGGLALAGVIFQVLLRNVLADPYILGVSGGAAVGALTAIATGLSAWYFPAQVLLAFITALAVVALVYVLGLRASLERNTLLLTGVMIGAFLSAIILGLISTMDRPVRTALFWLVGYLGSTGMTEVMIFVPIVFVLSVWAMFHAGNMNILALGEEAASHLGLVVRRHQVLLYVLASLLTATAVSVAGTIGFIGLLIPHLIRLLVGSDHRLLVPLSFFLGATFLIICDLLARSLLSPNEIPVGAVTAAIGAPLFIVLLRRRGPHPD